MGYLLFSLFILLLLTINQKNQISAQSSGNLWSNTFQEVNNEIESNIESILLYKRLNNSSGIKPLMSDIEFNKVNVSSTSNSHRKLDPVELEENGKYKIFMSIVETLKFIIDLQIVHIELLYGLRHTFTNICKLTKGIRKKNHCNDFNFCYTLTVQ